MAKSITLENRTVPGAETQQSAQVGGDTTYPTGGYPLLPTDFGFNVLRRIIEVRPRTVASAAYMPVVISTVVNGVITAANLALVVASTGAEVANGTNVSAASFYLIAQGN